MDQRQPLPSTTARRRAVVAKTVLSHAQRDGAGTQAIHRSLRILRMLASSPAQGETIANISAHLGLTHPTTYRIIKALEREGVVQRGHGAGASRYYTIGAELVWLGLGAAATVPITLAARAALEQLSRETGDSVFLAVRSGSDSVYVDRLLGSYPVQEVELSIGSRRPLGVNVAGRVILGWLPQATAQSLMQDNAARYAAFSCPTELILRDVALARQQGYIWNDSLTAPDRRVLAAPIVDVTGTAVAALCVIARRHRLAESRLGLIVPALLEAAQLAGRNLIEASQQQ